MQNIDNLSQKIHAHDDTPVLQGVQTIADYVGASVTFTKLLLETEMLKGIKTDDGWTAKPADLEAYRDAIQYDRYRQIATVAFAPRGFPSAASFSS